MMWKLRRRKEPVESTVLDPIKLHDIAMMKHRHRMMKEVVMPESENFR
jgi:hypothetical protein